MKKTNLTKKINELARAVNAANLAMYETMVAEGAWHPTRHYFAVCENRIALTAHTIKLLGPFRAEVR